MRSRRPYASTLRLRGLCASRASRSDRRSGTSGLANWAHGYALKAYWESADRVLDQVKRLAARKAMK
jgi:hypothetical protein